MFSTQVGNKKHKNKVINCPHTVTKCHQESALSLTWHLIICLQSESWQAPPSEPAARLWRSVLCQRLPTGAAEAPLGTRKTKASRSKGSLSAHAAAMFLLLMPSLPIKSATVNYCNYESEPPSSTAIKPPTPPPPNFSLTGARRHYGSCCVASVTPRPCSSEALAGNWMRRGTWVHMTGVTWGRLHGSSWITGQASHSQWPRLHSNSLNGV